MSPEKSRLVREAATALNFTPSRTARSLRTRSSEVIALVIPDIENPFFTSMARGVEDVAQAAGYSVVLCNTDDDLNKESQYLRIAISENMAGVVLAAASSRSDIDGLIAQNRPVVAVDRSPRGLDIDTVTVDNEAGGRIATQELFRRGYRRIACITGPRDVETAVRRAAGWRRVVGQSQSRGHADTYLRYSDYRVDGGRDAMRDLLSLAEPPDAVFVANNLMSVGALGVLVQRGLTPPGFGVAVFGDLPFAALVPAGIAVVKLPARELGIAAATLLLERIGGDTRPSRRVVLGDGLEPRGKSGHSS